MTAFHHVPVLRDEVVACLAPARGDVMVDCTVGGGGHAEALLVAAECRVIGLDRDPAAIAAATARCARFGARFVPVRAAFSELSRVLDGLGLERVAGVLADLGVSSHQLDSAPRGFSFQQAGPIDMRMDPDGPVTAADIVNGWPEAELADVIWQFGEERRSRRVARALVQGRPWMDTRSLAEAVARAVGGPRGRTHPATRTFQALRIATNQELDELRRLLPQVLERLEAGGRIAIISFHSLEDRIVKRFFAEQAGKGRARDPFGNPIGAVHLEQLRSTRAAAEDPNPRSRSARLRCAQRLP